MQDGEVRASSTSKLVADSDVISLEDGNKQRPRSNETQRKIEDVLSELRKVLLVSVARTTFANIIRAYIEIVFFRTAVGNG